MQEEDCPTKSTRYSVERVAFSLRQTVEGAPVSEVYSEMGISQQTQKGFQGMVVAEVRRLRFLDDENRMPQLLVVDLSPDELRL